jgi:DNA polymerase IV
VFVSITILHADADAFFASVEQRDDPALRGRPVIVGGGVVLAASYEAKACGVRTAMGGRQALRLCPRAVVVPPRMAAYSEASEALYAVFHDTTPLVEGLSIDEAFLDVRGMERLAGTPFEIGVRLRRRVRERVGIAVTVGIARTKFLAKVASGVAKPDGILLVPTQRELAFLHPLEVERMWGVGPATARRLRARGVETVGELSHVPLPELETLLGRALARHLHTLARNEDPRPVKSRARRRSIGSQRARGRRPVTADDVDADLLAVVERVMRRVRTARRVGRTVVLRLRFDDFTRATRSRTMSGPTARTATVVEVARGLLAAEWPVVQERGLTLVGVALTNLVDEVPLQLELPFAVDRAELLDEALDRIRDRFGSKAVVRGALVGRSPGIAMPLLPD